MGDYVMVVVDDLRSFRNEETLLAGGTDVRYARTSAEGIQILTELIESGTVIDEVWLDHDLGEDDSPYGFDTIMPVVAWLEELGYHGRTVGLVGHVVIHTANVSAVPAMQAALRPYFKTSTVNASDWFREI